LYDQFISTFVFIHIYRQINSAYFHLYRPILKMRFTTALLSLIIPAALVAAEVECDLNSQGPSAADIAAVIEAFVAKYAPDGYYRPQGTEFIPISHFKLLACPE
jgi:hypothetical protein